MAGAVDDSTVNIVVVIIIRLGVGLLFCGCGARCWSRSPWLIVVVTWIAQCNIWQWDPGERPDEKLKQNVKFAYNF